MSLQLHYTGQDYVNRGLAGGTLTPGSTSAIVGGCKTGKGFEFDNTVDSALQVNTNISMPSEFTVSCWAKVNDVVGGKTIWTNGGLFSSGFQIDFLNDKIRAFVYNTTSVAYVTQMYLRFVEANKWYHIVAGVRNNRVFLYVDKLLIGETVIIGTLKTDFNPIIGMRFDGGVVMDGQICNFKYYNHVLSQKEINDDYRSLILHYPLNKAITDSVLDVSGFQRHITNLTNNTVTLDSNSQVYSASLKNDGTQSLVGTSDLTDLNGLNEGSFSFRVFLTANNLSDQCVIYNMTTLTEGNGILFLFKNDVVVAFFYGKRIEFNYTPTVDAWHHVVLVKTSTQIKVYVDNVNIYTVSTTTSSRNFSNITRISSAPDGSNPISGGNIQDIRFYATALTEDDIKDLYNVRHSIDKDGNLYTYELIEGETSVGMKKSGQTNCDEFIEEDGIFRIKNNLTIKAKNLKEI